MSLKTINQAEGANKKYVRATKKMSFLAEVARYLENNQIGEELIK